MCGWFPEWPLQRVRSARREPDDQPLVLFAEAGRGGARVVAGCRLAARQGVAAGMPLAEAQGLLGATRPRRRPPVFLPHDPAEDGEALHKLAVWCQKFSPVVGVEPPDALLLEISGCGHLFGGEERLARQFSSELHRWRLVVRVAIADTPGAAWGLARYAPGEPVILVPPGGVAAALAPLPAAALRLPVSVLELLSELGLDRIGALRSLPREGLTARFGPELVRRLDQALGDVEEPIERVRPTEPLEASHELEQPAGDREWLQEIVRGLLAQVFDRLTDTPLGVQRLELHLRDAAGREWNDVVERLRPSRSTAGWMELIRMRLEQSPWEGEAVHVRLRVLAAAPLELQAPSLLAAGEAVTGGRDLAQLVDRLSCRLGAERVVRPVLRADPQPEYAVEWRSCLNQSPSGLAPSLDAPGAGLLPRPLRLEREPAAVQVTSIVPEGPPVKFIWNGRSRSVVRWWGPERIETGWWRGRPVRRDYYRVEADCGGWYWLFRRLDRGDWFLHGQFE